MFDPLKKEKLQLQQATSQTQLAIKYTQTQYEEAKIVSKRFISSPTGIATSFAAGSMTGALGNSSPSKATSSASTLTSLLLKFF